MMPQEFPASGQPPSDQIPPKQALPFLKRIQPVTFAILALFVVFVLYQIVASTAVLLLVGGRVTLANADVLRWATAIGQVFFILVPTVILAGLRHTGLREYFRIRLPNPGEIVVTVIAVFALQQMLQTYMMVQEAIPLPPVLRHYVDFAKKLFEEPTRLLVTAKSPSEFAFVVFSIALIPALAEELLFRGVVQRSMEEVVGGFRGALITGVIFGAYHLNPFSIVPLVALGVYFGFIVYRSDNITLAMSAHFFNNFITCTVVYLELNDDFVAISPSTPPASATILVNFAVFTLVFVAATYYFIKMTDHAEQE